MKVGDCFYKKNNRYKYHIVALLEAEPEIQIVYKYYGKRKQWWHYVIEDLYTVDQCFKSGLYYTR